MQLSMQTDVIPVTIEFLLFFLYGDFESMQFCAAAILYKCLCTLMAIPNFGNGEVSVFKLAAISMDTGLSCKVSAC